MKMEGRAEAFGDLADLICRLGEPRNSWFRLKAWVETELAEIRLECDLLAGPIWDIADED